jgi:transcriptional regulator with XRE-family HTH domain
MNATLAERLKWARKRSGLTQQQVAEAAGMTQPAYSDLESARSKSSALTASLANALRVSALWLERGVGTPEPVAIHEAAPPYGGDVSEFELALVVRFRTLSPRRQAALLELIADD